MKIPQVFMIVTGDFTPWGGMDRPNYELALYLAEDRKALVHLVSHRVASPLSSHPNVIWHRVQRPFGSHTLGSWLLDWRGRMVAKQITRDGGNVIVNGANCYWNDVNWIHYIHNVRITELGRISVFRRLWMRWKQARDRFRERWVVPKARLIIADSDMVRDQLIARIPIDSARIRTIYYGVDPEIFRPATTAERTHARLELRIPQDRPIVVFIGSLGHDRRKGFDVLFDAWCRCCEDPNWNAILLVAGTGSELPEWQRSLAVSGEKCDIRFLGFTKAIPALLSAADALVSPTRFEPYGQGVHEAICCGLPAFVTRCAGVSERYPIELEYLLLDDPPNSVQLFQRLQEWHKDIDGYRQRMVSFSEQLRRRTWSDMAADFVQAVIETKAVATTTERRVTN